MQRVRGPTKINTTTVENGLTVLFDSGMIDGDSLPASGSCDQQSPTTTLD